MRISDWSSDVCSSDLDHRGSTMRRSAHWRRLRGRKWQECAQPTPIADPATRRATPRAHWRANGPPPAIHRRDQAARKSGVSGKSVSVRVDLGGLRIIKKKKKKYHKP